MKNDGRLFGLARVVECYVLVTVTNCTIQGACMCIEDTAAVVICLDVTKTTSDIPKALHYFEIIRMPRVANIVEFARISIYIWTLLDGEKQQERDRKWKADSDELKRLREGCGGEFGGESKSEGLDQLRWIFSYDVFAEVSNLLML